MSTPNLPVQAPAPTLAETIDERLGVRTPESLYVLARESYAHWWRLNGTEAWLWLAYRHLPHYKRGRRPRVKSPAVNRNPMVQHTVVLPDGTTETYEWRGQHGRRYGFGWKLAGFQRVDEGFRRRHGRGVKASKGRRADSLDRGRKTMEFRNNAKTPTRWPFSNGAKRLAQVEDNRAARRRVRAEIRDRMKVHSPSAGEWDLYGYDALDLHWDSVCDWRDPVDTWKWD